MYPACCRVHYIQQAVQIRLVCATPPQSYTKGLKGVRYYYSPRSFSLLLSTDVVMMTTTMMATGVGGLIGGPIKTQRQTTGGGVDPLAQPIRSQQQERSLQ